MRFARPLRAELDEIVIALNERDESHELQQLASPAEALGVEADRLKQKVDPFICRRSLFGLQIAFIVEFGNLDRLEVPKNPRGSSLVSSLC